MQSEYKSQLPATLQALVDEIETSASVEISVKRAPDLSSELLADIQWGDGHGESWAIKSVGYGPPCDVVDRPIRCLTLLYRSDLAATSSCYPVPFAMVCH